MAKDKKKKDKKSAKSAAGLKALTENPLIGEVVAAALVATASALKDSNRARALASHASDELEKLSKSTGDRGGALWEMALQIGRRSLDAMMAGDEPKAAKAKAAKAKPTAAKDGPKPKAAGKKASKASTR